MHLINEFNENRIHRVNRIQLIDLTVILYQIPSSSFLSQTHQDKWNMMIRKLVFIVMFQ